MYGMFVVEWLAVKIIHGENFLKQCRIPALSAGIRHSDQIGNIPYINKILIKISFLRNFRGHNKFIICCIEWMSESLYLFTWCEV